MPRPVLYINQHSNHLEHAQKALCLKKTYCKQCKSCIHWQNSQHPDWIVIEDNSRSIGVDAIGNALTSSSTYPKYSKIKFISILNGESITESAQNKLLKTLEDQDEKIEWAFYIPASKISNLLDTIISRLKISNNNESFELNKETINNWKKYIIKEGPLPNERLIELEYALYQLINDHNVTREKLTLYIQYFNRLIFIKKYLATHLKIKSSSVIALVFG